MTTQAYQAFVDIIENPLKKISTDDGYFTTPNYLQGSIRHEANALRKGTSGRTLPALLAAYDNDLIVAQKQQPKVNRLDVQSYDCKSERTVTIHGIVASLEDGEEPGDYVPRIDELLYDVKRVLASTNLKLISVGFILDNEQQSLGLAGFVLKVSYNFNENIQP